jgi:hypothetical protein
MGLVANPNGITLKFADGSSVSGAFARLYSKRRPLAPDEDVPFLGSQDWLTDVLVADSKEKLDALPPTGTTNDQTSACSMNVCAQWDVGGNKGKLTGCTTIADGQPVDGKYLVNSIKILPGETPIAKLHDLLDEWEQKRHYIQALKAGGKLNNYK